MHQKVVLFLSGKKWALKVWFLELQGYFLFLLFSFLTVDRTCSCHSVTLRKKATYQERQSKNIEGPGSSVTYQLCRDFSKICGMK